MKISENKVYIFKFPWENTEFTLPVPAESKEEAAQKLQKWMSDVQTELAMEFPQVVASRETPVPDMPATSPEGIPSEVLEMRIDTLLNDLGAKGLTDIARAETIKNWTGSLFLPKNYTSIITELELIASGQKDVPVKNKKK